MKILITNVHSILNKGDAGIVISLIQSLRDRYKGCSIKIVSGQPELDEPFYRDHYSCEVTGRLVCRPEKSRPRTVRAFLILKDLLLAASGRNELIGEMEKADLILSCGGGFLFSYNRLVPEAGFLVHCAELYFATRRNKNVVLAPQSIGPFKSPVSRWLALTSIKRARLIFAREPISLEFLKGIGIAHSMLAMDAGFYLRPERADREWAAGILGRYIGKKAGVTLRKWNMSGLAREKYLSSIAEGIEHLRKKSYTVFLVPQVLGPGREEDDRDISMEMKSRFSEDPGVVYSEELESVTPSGMKAFYAGLDLLIGTRMHSVIFAAAEGVPVLCIAYQPKALGVLKMIGMEDLCYRIEDMGPGDIVKGIDRITSGKAFMKSGPDFMTLMDRKPTSR